MLNVPTLEKRFELEEARRIVTELANLIRPACARLEVGGSIRRGSPYVKDAELIAIPEVNPYEMTVKGGLWIWLDTLVERGVVEKAVYVDKNGKSSNRWGQLYRGILFQGIKVEIFLTHPEAWGYQKWLRTGPGEANTYIMSYLIYRKAAIRFIEGDGWYSPGNLWHKPKDKWIAEDKVQLLIPDEETLFALLGMPYLPPNERGEQRYKQLMGNNRQHRWPEFGKYVLKQADAAQVRLVDVEPVAVVVETGKAGAEPMPISPLSVTDANADDWALQVYQETLARTERRLSEARLMAGTYPSYARRVGVLESEVVMLRSMVE